MNFLRKIILLFLFILPAASIFSQVPGTWKEYFSYNNVKQIISIEDNIFALSENGIFVYNTTTKEIQKITKLQGLSDVGLTCMAFCDSTSSILIGFSNGCLNILSYPSLSIKVNKSLMQKNMQTSKKINKIVIQSDTAILATEAGVFTFSMTEQKFLSFTLLSNNGSYVPAKSVTHNGDEIFVATTNGIYASNHTNNLANFSTWRKITGIPHENDTISFISSLNRTVYYAYLNQNEASNDMVYSMVDGNAQAFKTQPGYITNLHRIQDNIAIISSYCAKMYNCDEYLKFSIDTILKSVSFLDLAFVESEAFIADENQGVFTKDYSKICPPGPQSNRISSLRYSDSKLLTTSGYIVDWERAMFDYMDYLGNWYSHKTWNVMNARCAYTPQNSDTFYYGSFGGLVSSKFKTWWLVDSIYDHTNSCIQSHMYYKANVDIVSDISEDSRGNIWFLNQYSTTPLIAISSDKQWYNFSVGNIGNWSFEKLLVDSRGIKWLLGESKLVAFYDYNTLNDTSDDLVAAISLNDSEGTIASRTTCATEDLEGEIWIGTNQGIAIHSAPARVFNDRQSISRIKIEIDGEVGYLLHSEIITCIAVDGANRKWIGTERSGVFLVSENGTEQLLNFTSSNSYLPSNDITGIQIDNATGEVFIATDQGLVSYICDATAGDDSMKKVYVFPNPVRENYEGNIYIKGLKSNSIVKITDVSGNLVKGIRSNGGIATWEGRNIYGERVHTGIYFIYISDEDGKVTEITKILFIN